MNRPELLIRLNRLLALCSSEESFNSKPWGRAFISAHQLSIFVSPENVKEFDGIVIELHRADRVASSYSKQTFSEIILHHLRNRKVELLPFLTEDLQKLQTDLASNKEATYRILRDLHGASISKRTEPLAMGPFTIYHRPSHEIAAFGERAKSSLHQMGDRKSEYLIECQVIARDSDKALERADRLFNRFELLIWLMVGRRNQEFLVGVVNYSKARQTDRWIIGNGHTVVGHAWEGALQSLALDGDYFLKLPDAMKRIWSMAGDPANNLEERVVRSAEWLGQALADPNPSCAFVKASTALEVLLSHSGRGLINSSIMAQIAENCAHIIGNSPSQREGVEAEIKELYGVRSAIVHSGIDEVPIEALDRFDRLGSVDSFQASGRSLVFRSVID